MKEFGGGGGMIALVFMDLQEEKCILRATPPQREYNHTITKKKKKSTFIEWVLLGKTDNTGEFKL